jgi:hypothetical protein
MRLHSRWLAVAVPAALAALVFGGTAASPAPVAAAPHVTAASVTGARPQGVVHIIHRGLVKDCEYIESGTSDYYIEGHGVNEPVSLTTGPGSCFDLYNSFSYPIVSPLTGKDVTATVYQYQDLSGHCLWQNDTSFELELGVACNASDTSEDFFGIPGSHAEYGGWLVSVVADWAQGLEYYMDLVSINCPFADETVYMEPGNVGTCYTWNFPS